MDSDQRGGWREITGEEVEGASKGTWIEDLWAGTTGGNWLVTVVRAVAGVSNGETGRRTIVEQQKRDSEPKNEKLKKFL